MAHVRASHLGDPALLAPYLREADLDEIEAATHLSPFEALHSSYYMSKPCKTIIGDTGNVIGMYGVAPMRHEGNAKLGIIWCLTSPELFTIKKQFLRHCRQEIEEVTEGYDKVLNFIYSKNTRHIRWVKAMGFTVEAETRPFGWQEKPFYYFEKVIT